MEAVKILMTKGFSSNMLSIGKRVRNELKRQILYNAKLLLQ